MGPIELSLRNRAHEIHSRLRNTRPPENQQLQAIIDSLREQLTKANEIIENMKRKRRQHSIHRIIDLVCETEKISRVELLSERRTKYICHARHIGYFLAATMTPFSLPQIGHYFGGRDHTTVLHGRDKLKDLRASDPLLEEKLSWYEARMGEISAPDKRGA